MVITVVWAWPIFPPETRLVTTPQIFLTIVKEDFGYELGGVCYMTFYVTVNAKTTPKKFWKAGKGITVTCAENCSYGEMCSTHFTSQVQKDWGWMDGWMEHRPAMIGNHVTDKEREAVFVTNGVRKGVWAPINWADWKLRKEVFTSVADR